jgi:predicted Zn-dependent protease with MMP-like domain
MLQVSETEFDDLVAQALDSLPDDLLEVMSNVEVTVEPMPNARQLRSVGVRHGTLLGLYEGIPLTERNSGYSMVLPDKITIFQRTIERICGSHAEIVAQVRQTVIHEVAHHFGISDARLEELGWA